MSQAITRKPLIQAGSAWEIFNRQRAAWLANPYLPLASRRHALMVWEALLMDNQQEIAETICRDFGHRSLHETKLLEIFPVVSGLVDARRRLKKWVKPQQRHVSFWFMGAKNRVIPQPNGVVGIVSPWNYPLQLAICSLTSALAAGNRCMIKMDVTDDMTLMQEEIFGPLLPIKTYRDLSQAVAYINGRQRPLAFTCSPTTAPSRRR